jgi:hypothetical protein
MAAIDAVDVNAGSDEDLRRRLLGTMFERSWVALPRPIVERIIALRPFASIEDLVRRVNAAAAGPWDRLGKKMLPRLCVRRVIAERRDAATAKQYIGRWIDVPYSGWGWSEPKVSRGLVFKYQAQLPGSFVVVFLPSEATDDIQISWAQLHGETPWGLSASDTLRLVPADVAAQHSPPDGRQPSGAAWDMRRGAWIDRRGELFSVPSRVERRARDEDQTLRQRGYHAAYMARSRSTQYDLAITERSWLIPSGDIDQWRWPPTGIATSRPAGAASPPLAMTRATRCPTCVCEIEKSVLNYHFARHRTSCHFCPCLLAGDVQQRSWYTALGDLRIGPLGGYDGSCRCPTCRAPLFDGEKNTKCCLFRTGAPLTVSMCFLN